MNRMDKYMNEAPIAEHEVKEIAMTGELLEMRESAEKRSLALKNKAQAKLDEATAYANKLHEQSTAIHKEVWDKAAQMLGYKDNKTSLDAGMGMEVITKPDGSRAITMQKREEPNMDSFTKFLQKLSQGEKKENPLDLPDLGMGQ